LAAEVPTSSGDGGPDHRWRRRYRPSLAPEVPTIAGTWGRHILERARRAGQL